MVERRLRHGLGRSKPRRISVYFEGRVLTGTASTHKLVSGRLYNLRLRIWRRVHTVPLIMGNDAYPWSSLRRTGA
jgi:hypothetical protein